MKSSYLSRIKAIAEKAFTLDDISSKCRKRVYINARAWFYKACREVEEYNITHEEAGKFVNRDHATSMHGVKEYDIYLNSDGYEAYHFYADHLLKAWKENREVYNPVKWRDRKIERLKKIIRKYQEICAE